MSSSCSGFACECGDSSMTRLSPMYGEDNFTAAHHDDWCKEGSLPIQIVPGKYNVML